MFSGEMLTLVCDDTPYRPPEADAVESIERSDEAAAIRKAHLYHEAAVEFVGALFVIVGAATAIVTVAMAPFIGNPPLWRGFLLTAWMVFVAVVGVGLLMRRSWSRPGAIAISSIALIVFPIGTFIGAGSLYLLLSDKGRYVMTRDYEAVVAETPLTRSVPFVLTLWVFLAGLLAVFVAADYLL